MLQQNQISNSKLDIEDQKQKAILDFNLGVEDFGEQEFIDMVINFEQSTFDIRMKTMLDGMLEKDWAKAMVSAHTMKGSCGYIYANRFLESCRIYQEHIKRDCERIEYSQSDAVDLDRPQYRIKPIFDIAKQIQAYEYFFQFMEEAIILKQEMSKITHSRYLPNLYDEQVQIIKKYYEKLKKSTQEINKQNSALEIRSQSKGKSSGRIQINPEIQQHQQQNQQVEQELSQQPQSQLQNVTIDQPIFGQCCDRCDIF